MTGFGPRIEADGVCFRLWAPDAQAVTLEIQGGQAIGLTARAEGWKEAFAPCGPGTRYRFRIGDRVFADPASRLQSGGVHGWSVVCPALAAAGDWYGRPWQEVVLYECHAGLLAGFCGVADKLEDLAQLGISAVELMPIAAFPGRRNWGYDGVLPFAPAECYGTPAELKALIDKAHGLGMMIFLDVVYNHFGPDGNDLSLYAERFFRDDIRTPWGAAIDFRQPQVRAFFAQNARQWLFEYGFDGLRLDAVHAIKDDGWLDALALSLRKEAGKRHIHLVVENEDNQAPHLRAGRFDAQWNDDIHHSLHVLLTGEAQGYYRDFSDRPAARLARGLAEGFVYQGDASRTRKGAPRGTPSADLPATSFVSFLQNHDQIGNRPLGERLARLADPQALKAAVVLLLLMPQIPLIFMGEEIGSKAPFLYFTDHGPELAQGVREGRRREFATFAQALPDPNAVESFASSDPKTDAPDAPSWLALYSRLLALRRARIIPLLGTCRSLGARSLGPASIIAGWRLDRGCELVIASNFAEEAVAADLPADETLIWGSPSRLLGARTSLAWMR